MRFLPTEIPDVVLVTPRVFEDARGAFFESWNATRFAAAGLDESFVQDNHSHSVQGTLRGLHYQVGAAQGKLLRVVRGRIFDVAVDLRRSSPTLGRWVGAWLSDRDRRMLWVPAGFAHGFYVASAVADVIYKCTDFYSPEHERTIAWDDPDLAIEWPLAEGRGPLLSGKDSQGTPFAAAELFP